MDTLRERLTRVVNDLFVNGQGEPADRLVLSQAGRDIGGWCRGAIIDRLEAALSAPAPTADLRERLGALAFRLDQIADARMPREVVALLLDSRRAMLEAAAALSAPAAPGEPGDTPETARLRSAFVEQIIQRVGQPDLFGTSGASELRKLVKRASAPAGDTASLVESMSWHVAKEK